MSITGKQPAGGAGGTPPEGGERLFARVSAALGQALEQPLEPGLYLVSTPIGNLADISLRALAVLARADVVLAEDTRHTGRLASHFGLDCALRAYHEHNAARERPRVLARLRAGERVALVADAGTPIVSDPGYKLARAALEEGLKVTSIPGASAALAALASAGIPGDTFLFAGFPPAKRAGRRKRLAGLAEVPATLIFFEAPSRLAAMLADAREVLGAREAAVAKELTKLHEAVLRGPLDQLVENLGSDFAGKGEFVVLIGPPAAAETSDAAIEARLRQALETHSVRDATREVAAECGVGRNRVYKLALALGDEGGK